VALLEAGVGLFEIVGAMSHNNIGGICGKATASESTHIMLPLGLLVLFRASGNVDKLLVQHCGATVNESVEKLLVCLFMNCRALFQRSIPCLCSGGLQEEEAQMVITGFSVVGPPAIECLMSFCHFQKLQALCTWHSETSPDLCLKLLIINCRRLHTHDVPAGLSWPKKNHSAIIVKAVG
jgi:hypothetical protein